MLVFSLCILGIRKDYFNVAQLENHGPNHADENPRKLIRCICGSVSTRILQKIYSLRSDVVFFRWEALEIFRTTENINKCWLSIVCSFPKLMIEIREKLKKSTTDLTDSENLHKHAQAAILPTDAFKLQISAQRRRLALCW